MKIKYSSKISASDLLLVSLIHITFHASCKSSWALLFAFSEVIFMPLIYFANLSLKYGFS